MKVVIFKFNHFGDNVVFVPAVQALRRLEPSWQVTLLTTPNEAELYGGPQGPQHILTSPKRVFDRLHLRPHLLLRWLWKVRREHPDACLISFDQGSAAHLVARLSGAPIRIGGNLEHIRIQHSLTEDITLPPDRRPVTWHWEMLRALLHRLGSTAMLPAMPPPPDFQFLGAPATAPAAGRPRVLVHAGASKHLNHWGQENFAAVARALAQDCDVAWVEHANSTWPAPSGTMPLRPHTAGELASQLRNCDLYLGNNSGPMHLANALGCHGVAVTGPSALGWDPYWHRSRWTVLRHPNLACAPCEQPNKALLACTNLEHPMACFAHWTAEKVVAACRTRLASPRE